MLRNQKKRLEGKRRSADGARGQAVTFKQVTSPGTTLVILLRSGKGGEMTSGATISGSPQNKRFCSFTSLAILLSSPPGWEGPSPAGSAPRAGLTPGLKLIRVTRKFHMPQPVSMHAGANQHSKLNSEFNRLF